LYDPLKEVPSATARHHQVAIAAACPTHDQTHAPPDND